jgi:hypothetical protein
MTSLNPKAMKPGKPKTAFELSCIIMLLIMMSFPVITDPEKAFSSTLECYSSDHHFYSFIMTSLLVFFGISSVMFTWKHIKRLAFQRFALISTTGTFIVAAILANPRFYNGLISSIPVKTIHRCFAGISVISFSFLAISTSFLLSDARGKKISFCAGIAVLVGALLQSEMIAFAGLWQRMIILVFAGWLLYINRYSELKDITYHL